MFPPARILFPVDFSERSLAAARMAETFAGHFQAHLFLLHVVEPLTYNDLPADAGHTAKDRMAHFLADELKHFDVKRTVAYGDPASTVIDYAESEKIDLIMLPTHGYGRFRRFILGSVAAKVLHDAKCAVWTDVHVEKIPPLEQIAIKNIVCAVDLGKQTCAALKYAHGMATDFHAELTVVHCVPQARDLPNEYSDAGWWHNLVENAQSSIENLLADMQIRATIRIESDDVARGVKTCADAVHADLVVIGRSVEDNFLGRLRTNAYSVIRQSPCPVISV